MFPPAVPEELEACFDERLLLLDVSLHSPLRFASTADADTRDVLPTWPGLLCFPKTVLP